MHTTEYYSPKKMNKILPFATWMDSESMMLSEIKEKEQILCDFTNMWNLK